MSSVAKRKGKRLLDKAGNPKSNKDGSPAFAEVWRARYRDDDGREHARHFRRKTDAESWLDEVTTAKGSGTYVDPNAGRVTFSEFYEAWADRQTWVANSRRASALAAQSVTFGGMPLRSIRRSHVEAWVKSMTATDLQPSTIRTRYVAMRSVFRAAVLDRLIGVNPAERIKLPKARKAEHAMQIPTAEQVGALIAAADPQFSPFIALCAFAGLRLGEASGVQVRDVDFLRRELHVARQVQRGAVGTGLEVRAPKYGSERTVYLPDALVTMLDAHVREQALSGDAWLFHTFQGGPLPPSTVNTEWRRAVVASGVPGARMHGLRHFYASGLIAAGCDVVTVQRALGHSSASTTLGTYAHLWPSADDRTRAAASGLMRTAFENRADSLRTAPNDRAI